MRALDFPKIKPFTAAFFIPVDIAEQGVDATLLKPFFGSNPNHCLTKQLVKHELPCGMGHNHDNFVQMSKRELLEDLAMQQLEETSSHLHLQGLPKGQFYLGGALKVNPFYHRRILNMHGYYDQTFEKRMLVGRTFVLDAIKNAVRDMLVASGIGEEDFGKIAIVIGTDTLGSLFFRDAFNQDTRLFGDSSLSGITLDIVTSLNLRTRYRFTVTLALKNPNGGMHLGSFGNLLHQPDEVTNETLNAEPVLIYHCRYKHAAINPLLADIRMDLGA